jgi:hypothetical protein
MPHNLFKKVVTVLPSAARTAAPSPATYDSGGYRGLRLDVNVSVVAGSGEITTTIKGVDPLSGTEYTLLADAAQSTVSHSELIIYPGVVAVANVALNQPLPKRWTVDVAHTNGDAVTYSVVATLLP